MKKLYALLLLMVSCQLVFCQTYTEVINKFKDKSGAEFTEFPKSFFSQGSEEGDLGPVSKNMDCMKILGVEKCDENIRTDFVAQIKKFENKYNKYEEKGDMALFYEGSKESVKAAIVVSFDMRDCGMIVLEGKFSASQLETISEVFMTIEEAAYDGEYLSIDELDLDVASELEGTADVDIAPDMMVALPPPPPMEQKPEPVIENKTYTMGEVGEQPEFPGGDAAMYQWLGENVVYPPKAQENGISGTVVVSFTISKDGSVTNIKIARGKDPALDKEAVRVVSIMPKWKPGVLNGEPVPVSYTLPLKFQLTGPEKEESGGQ